MLDRLAHVVTRHRRRVLLVTLILVPLSIVLASRVRFDPDMLNFLPSQTREVATFREVLGALGTLDRHIVAVELPRGAHAEDYAPLVERLARDFDALDSIEQVGFRIPDPMAAVERLLPKAMLFLTPEEVEDVAPRLSDAAIAEAMAENRSLLQTPQAFVAKDLVRLDPLRLHTIPMRRLLRSGGGFRLDAASGYYLSSDHTTYVILARPARPAHDIPFSTALMSQSRAIAKRAVASFQREHPNLTPPAIAFAGGYAINTSDADLVRADMISNVVGSCAGVLALIVLAFRRARAVLFAALPMALALVATFAFATLAVGTLSAASAGFAALLAGLGIDFITVFYGRYAEERAGGADVDVALLHTIRSTLPGITLAAITTALTFYAFLFTDFRGMTQMGLLTGTGILLFLAAVALVLPALVASFDRATSVRPVRTLTGFGADRLVRAAVAHPLTTISIWLIVVAATGLASLRLTFNDDPANLRAHGNEGVNAQERLAQKFGRSFDFVLLIAEGATADDALARSETLLPRLDALVQRGVIGGYQSLSSILPSPRRQQNVIARLAAGRNDTFDVDRIETAFHRAATNNGFRAEAWSDYLVALRASLTTNEPLRIERENDPVLTLLRERFLQPSRGHWIAVTYLYPPGQRWGRAVAPELQAIDDEDPHVTLTGVNVVAGALRRIARADAIRATIIGIVGVFVLFTIVFRSPRTAAFLFLPFVVGCISMTGLMSVLGIPFNPINVFVGLMLIGVGTDYAIYMVQRYREAPDALATSAPETAKAVTMAVLMSAVGYGSFALSHYPALRSIGYASMFGITASGLAAITLVPALLALRRGRAARSLTPTTVRRSS